MKKKVFLGYVLSSVPRSNVGDFGLKNCTGLMSLKSYVESDAMTRGRFDVCCAVLDEGAGDEELFKSVDCRSLEFACFSCFAYNLDRTVRFAKYLKTNKPEIKIVFGGPETLDPARILHSAPFADAVVCGEGEAPLVRLLAGEKDVPHVSFGGVRPRIDARPAILSSLELAPPVFSRADSKLLSGEVYYQTSRGCPENCEHCTMGLYLPVRRRSIAAIEHDFKIIFSSKDLSLLTLCDGAVDADPAHFAKVLNVAAKLNKKSIPMSGYTYLSKLGSETTKLMRAASFGYARVCMAPRDVVSFDSGQRGSRSARRFANLLRLAEEPFIKISIHTTYIHPGSTLQDFQEMFEVFKKYGLLEFVEAPHCELLPGTKLTHRQEELQLKYNSRGLRKITSCTSYTAEELLTAAELFKSVKSKAMTMSCE